MLRYLTWLSFPRSGTNFMSDSLHTWDGPKSFREIFQPQGVHLYNKNTNPSEKIKLLAHLSKTLNGDFHDFRDTTLIHIARTRPLELLQALREVYPEKIISYKIFQYQLSSANLSTVLKQNDNLNVFLTRNPVDSYISLIKSKITATYVGADTTKLKPTIRATDYLNYLEKRASWIQELNNLKVPIVSIS